MICLNTLVKMLEMIHYHCQWEGRFMWNKEKGKKGTCLGSKYMI